MRLRGLLRRRRKTVLARDPLADYGPGRGTWTCHVCKDERPDAMIGVYKRKHVDRATGITMTENIRYCLDRPECVVGATTYSHFKEPV